MEVSELVKLKNGRKVTMTMTEHEHREIFAAGVNFLLQKGWLVLGSKDEAIGTESAIKEVEKAIDDSEEATKQ